MFKKNKYINDKIYLQYALNNYNSMQLYFLNAHCDIFIKI